MDVPPQCFFPLDAMAPHSFAMFVKPPREIAGTVVEFRYTIRTALFWSTSGERRRPPRLKLEGPSPRFWPARHVSQNLKPGD